MIRHQRTIKGTGNQPTIVWMSGGSDELLDLQRRSHEQYGEAIRTGHFVDISKGFPSDQRFQMAFLFERDSDAMLFKLSN